MSGYDLDVSAPRPAAVQAAYVQASIPLAQDPGATLDVPYGPDPRQRYDVFPAQGENRPAILFFHGGYWKAGTKEARRFPAPVWQARGVTWITAEYRLCPAYTLGDLVDDARAALSHLHNNAARFGLDPARIHVAGNSAGAHLAAMAAATGPAHSVSLLSGLFDLKPVVETQAQDWLSLAPDAVRSLSPVNSLLPPDVPVIAGWGGDETPVFEWQTRAYAGKCLLQGNSVEIVASPGTDHFEVIADYARPDSSLFQAICRVLGVTA